MEHRAFVRAIARELLRDDHRAEDVAQESLLAALRRPPRGRNVRGWLGAVARNLALMARRSEGRRRRRERQAARPEAVLSPSEVAERKELLRLVADAVFELEEPYRSTVIRRYYEQWSVKEIAQRSGVPEETVRTRLKRAIHKLRERLDREHDGDRRAWSATLSAFVLSESAAGAPASATVLRVAVVLAVGSSVLVTWLLWRGAAEEGTDGSRRAARPEGRAANAVGAESVATERKEAASAPVLNGHVLDAEGRPLPGARVEVVRALASSPFPLWQLERKLFGRDSVTASAVTDTGGAYRLPLPGRGTYWLHAAGASGLHQILPPLVIKESLQDLDFHLTGATVLSGVVVDEHEEPLASVALTLVRSGDVFKMRAPRLAALSDAEGRFTFRLSRGGVVVLTARHEGYAPTLVQVPEQGLKAVGTNFEQAVRYRIGEEEDVGQGGGGEVFLRLERGHPARLEVRDEGGRAVSDAHVLLAYGRTVAAGRTDMEGRVRFPAVDPAGKGILDENEGFLLVRAGGYAPRIVALRALEMRGGVLDLGTVELSMGATVRGVARLQDTNEPVPGALVSSLGGVGGEDLLGETSWTATLQRTTADGRGWFVLNHVPRGALALIAFRPGHLSDPRARWLLPGKSPPLFGDRGVEEIEKNVHLTKASVLRGVVHGPDGAPVEGAIVSVSVDYPSASTAYLGIRLATTSGDEGRFELRPPDALLEFYAWHPTLGRSKLVAVEPGSVETLILTLGATEPREEAAGEPLVRWPAGGGAGVLHGRVLVGDTPLAGAVVIVGPLTGKGFFKASARTDEDGSYRIDGLPAGDYLIELLEWVEPRTRKKLEGLGGIVPADMAPLLLRTAKTLPESSPRRVHVAAGASVQRDLRSPRRVRVVGTVSHRGKRLPGIEVDLVPAKGNSTAGWRRARTGTDGVLRLKPLAPGDYHVSCEVRDIEVRLGVHEIGDQDPARLDLALGPYTVRLRVADAEGRPVEKANVEIWKEGEAYNVGVRTFDAFGRKGVYTMPYVAEGRFGAHVDWNDAEGRSFSVAERRNFVVGPANPGPEVDLRLSPMGTLLVRAVDTAGRPLKGVEIWIQYPSSPRYVCPYPTDRNGELRMRLTARTWHVHVGGEQERWPAFKGRPRAIDVRPGEVTRVEFVVSD
jgi:RNA polymerase sigma-70 factor (ECF subfamily)